MPVLDLTTLLEAYGEINEPMCRTLRMFLKTMPAKFVEIETRINTGELKVASELAHAAKGVANMTGAFSLGELCSEIDYDLRQGDIAAVRDKLPILQNRYREVAEEIQGIIESATPIGG